MPLHMLLVAFQAMKHSGHVRPIVTEGVQDCCMQRLTAPARFNDGLSAELASEVAQQFCDEHAERYLLSFFYGYLGHLDLLRVCTEAEKYLLVAALKLASA